MNVVAGRRGTRRQDERPRRATRERPTPPRQGDPADHLPEPSTPSDGRPEQPEATRPGRAGRDATLPGGAGQDATLPGRAGQVAQRPDGPAAPHQVSRAATGRARDRAEPAVEVEPTTGAPVDALPRRVPVRQPKRWRRLARVGAPADEDPADWKPIEEVHWDGTPIRDDLPPERVRPDRAARRRDRRPAYPPDPLPGLAALLALSLVATFFAWVSAGPLWVALGHRAAGTVVLTDCTGGGLTQRCRGIFTADGGRFVAHGVRVSGVPADRATTGGALPARMTGPRGTTAYADTAGAAHHLRWLLGLLAVVGCGAGIARWTGATRLSGPRARRWAVGAAFAGPVLILLGFLTAAW